jgi:ribosome-binding factor A
MRRQPTFTRADRLEHLLIDEVERLLAYEVRSPLAQLVKVTGGRLSPDLGHLRIQFVLHDGTEPGPPLQEMLLRSAPFIGRMLSESFQLRVRPQVAFHFDREAMRMTRVQQLLDEDKAKHPPPPEEPSGNKD